MNPEMSLETDAELNELLNQYNTAYDGGEPQSPSSGGDFSSIGDFSSPMTTPGFAPYGAPPFSPAPAGAPPFSPAPGGPPPGVPYEYQQPTMMQLHESTLLINKILQLQQHQNAQLEQMRIRQHRLFEAPQQEEFLALDTEQRQLLVVIDQSIKELEELLQRQLLQTNELFRVTFLQNELTLQRRQLELYHFELQQLVGINPGKPLAFLVIVCQPFPNVFYKGQILSDGELVLRLLTGAAVTVEQVSPVKAAMIIESHQAMKGDHKMLASDTQLMDLHHLVKFPLQFCEGTRKTGVHLRFAMSIRVTQNFTTLESTIESDSSQPLVVMTNQKQWEACERTLLLRDAFLGQLEVPWCQFANALQRQFVRSAKQDPANPTRCLSVYDFSYLRNKFFGGRSIVHQKDYDAFWLWYGKCLQVIRFQRHILQLWQNGMVYGLMTREDVDAALQGRTPGNFVIRFSERHPGQFGIAYVGTERPWRIKHYLVQPNDTAAAKFTLPDFCRDKGQFTTLLQYSLDPATGRPRFTALSKDQAFEQYYSRRTGGDTSGSGYEPLG